MGANVNQGENITINPLLKPLSSFEMTIPGDPSSASFFAAAAAMIPNSDLTIKNVLANPTRIGFFSIMESMGADITWKNLKKVAGEFVGDVRILPPFAMYIAEVVKHHAEPVHKY